MLFGIKTDKDVRDAVPHLLRHILCATINRYYHFINGKNQNTFDIFISHTKSGEEKLQILDDFKAGLESVEKKINLYVDRNKINYGDDFEYDIYRNATTRSMVFLLTDDISERDWCQREIFYAKKYLMPIIIVDAMRRWDERLFTYIGNVPMIKYTGSNMFDIYELLAFESLMCFYNRFRYDFEDDTRVLCRKIELLDFVAINFPKSKKSQIKTIIYPDPPVYWTERQIIESEAAIYGVKVATPITRLTEKFSIKKRNVLISSSKDGIDYIDGDCCVEGIDYAVKEITRYLIFNSFTIINGGHFKKGGFNELIMQQIEAYGKRLKNKVYAICYINAFNYKNEAEEIRQFQNRYEFRSSQKGRKYSDYIRLEKPDEKEQALSKSEQLALNRLRMVNASDFHIVIGGINNGPSAIDDEVEASVALGKPVFLLGGFGYKARELCDRYVNQNKYESLNNGLTLEQNELLAKSKDIDEILILILTGLKKSEKVNRKYIEN